LDVGILQNENHDEHSKIKTNYQDIQYNNVPFDKKEVENFLTEENISTDVINNDSNEQYLNNSIDVPFEKEVVEEQFESAQLFTSDQELSENNEQILPDSVETDLSDINFDDKDDLEIPAFLRRQTN
jgi:cell division protein FtsZ